MVSSGILEYRRSGEVMKNYTIRYGIDVNPDINKHNFITKLI